MPPLCSSLWARSGWSGADPAASTLIAKAVEPSLALFCSLNIESHRNKGYAVIDT